MNILKKIRVEDLIATLLFYYSIKMSSNFYDVIISNVVVSRHIIAIFILLLFAITTSIYKIRKTIIVDSIKSEVQLPQLKIKDEIKLTWKNRKQIMVIVRDYLPFLLIIISYYSLSNMIPIISKKHEIFTTPSFLMSIASFIKETINGSHQLKYFAQISYNTYIVSVPVLAVYMYLLKTQRAFRRLMLAVSISALTGIMIAKSSKLGINHLSMPVCFTTIVLVYAGRVSKPVTHFFLPIATLLLAMDIAINMPYIYTTIAGILNAITAIFISDTVIKLEYKLRRKFFG